MSKDEFKITKGVIVKPRNILIYGPPGVGKTSWASEAPKPIIIQTEEGANDIGTDRLPLVKTYDEFIAQLRFLFLNRDGYETLIIDSLNWLEILIHNHVSAEHGAEHIEDSKVTEFQYQAGYGYALDKWGDIMFILKTFGDDYTQVFKEDKNGKVKPPKVHKALNVIMIAHSCIHTFQDPTTDTYDRYMPALHVNKKGIGANARVQQICDEVLFINEKVYTKVTEDKKGNKTDQTKGIGTGERVVFTERRPAFEAKNRLSLPAEMPYKKGEGWSEYALFLPGVKGEK